MKFPAIQLREKKISRKEVEKNIFLRARVLEEKYRPGRIVWIIAEKKLESVYWIYACFYKKYKFCLIPPDTSKVEWKKIAATVPSPFLVVDGKKFNGLAKRLRKISFLPRAGKEKDFQAIIFTSGSTGNPKAVALSWKNLLASAMAHSRHFSLSSKDTWLCSLPIYHVSGFSILSRAFFLEQSLLAWDEENSSTSVRYWLNSGKISGISIVPTILHRLLRDSHLIWHPRLRIILTGGAAIHPTLLKQILQLYPQIPLYLTYGLTETSAQIATSPCLPKLADRMEHLQVLSGVQIRIAANDEVLVRGKSVCAGYYLKKKFHPRRRASTWLKTGDWGHIHSNGSINILGRKNDLIISGGMNIYPMEIENALQSIKEIHECAVIGVPDGEWGERVVAFYSTPTQKPLRNLARVKERLRKILSSRKVPKDFYFLPSLPRTRVGKIAKNQLKTESLKK